MAKRSRTALAGSLLSFGREYSFPANACQNQDPEEGICCKTLSDASPHLILEVDDLLHFVIRELPLCSHHLLPLLRTTVEEAGIHLAATEELEVSPFFDSFEDDLAIRRLLQR